MTISDYLKRRVRRLFLGLFAVWLAIPLSLGLFGWDSMKGQKPPWPVAVFFPCFAVVALMLARTKCPRCKGSLYGLVGNIAFRAFWQKRVRYCPYCRVDFDEPMTSPGDSR